MLSFLLVHLILLLNIVNEEISKKTYDLFFTPTNGDIVVVKVEEDTQWEYKDHDMKGAMRTGLTLRWRIARHGDQEGFTAKASFDRVLYRGQGVKKGKEFNHHVEWTAEDHYLKGQGSDADKRWVASELAEGVTLGFDHRGACRPGEC